MLHITRTRATPSINSSSPSLERPVSPDRLSPDWQPRYSLRLESQQDLDFYEETSSDFEAERRSQSQSNSNRGGYTSSPATAVEDKDHNNSSGQPSSAEDGVQLTHAWSTQINSEDSASERQSSSFPANHSPRRSSAPRRKGTAKVLEILRDIPEDEAVTDAEEGWEDTQSPLQPNVGTSWQYRHG